MERRLPLQHALYSDALYGSGLRTDAPGVPNGASVPQYYSINLGAEQSFKLAQNQMLKARLDVVNLTDNIYELRDGSGVGVNAAQYGERLGFFGSLSLRSERTCPTMTIMDANRTSPGYELKDELARLCLSTARREPERKLAWVNSVCILFLLIGILGARQGVIAIKPVPPIRQEVPVVVQPTVLPPQPVAPKPEQAQPNNQPRVLVALPNAPNVNFGVPTAGTLVTDAALASAPQAAPVQIRSLNNTGAGGERPEPPYPPIAQQTGEQGTVAFCSPATTRAMSSPWT